MFIKLPGIKSKFKPKKVLKTLAIFLLVVSWLLTGWPGVSFMVSADTSGAKYPTVAVTVLEAPWSDNHWTNAVGVYSDNGNQASVTAANFDSPDQTYVLKAEGFDFSAIPDGSTINGVTVRVNAWYANGSGSMDLCQLLDASGAKVGTNNCSTPVALTTSNLTVITKGGSADTWGNSLTTAWIKNSNFGVAIGMAATQANADVFIEYITLEVTYTPPITTTLGDGTNPGNASLAPGGSITDLDAFTFITSSGTDTINSLTVTLGPAGAYNSIDQAVITDNSNTVKCTLSSLSSNTLNFTTCGLSAGTSPTTYKVRVTPKSHANMPSPSTGQTYDTTGTVTSWTSVNGNTQLGSDGASATVTIDNLSPNGATGVSGTAGNAAVTLNWTTSNSGDFDTTNGSVVLRWASGTAGSEVPVEGNSSYVAGNTITTATVACVISSAGSSAQSKIDGTGGSAGCTTTALTNGQAYTYKAFQRDTNGNYDTGVSIGTFTPTAAVATFTQNKYLWYVDNDLADPTAIWGNPDLTENQSIVVIPAGNDPPGVGQELRLRVNYVVNTTGISISEKYFKLEYKAGTDGSCTTGSWTDVGTGDWVYATSTVTDGADITKVISDTTVGKGEEYVKGKPSQVNHVAASAAEIIEYDFHIIGTGSTANTQYSFRVVETNSGGTSETVFDTYTNCPTLTTEPGISNLLRHGNVFTEGLEKGFFWAD